MRIRFGDGSGTLDYRTCSICGADCAPEPFEAAVGEGIFVAFTCPQCGLHSVVHPYQGSEA